MKDLVPLSIEEVLENVLGLGPRIVAVTRGEYGAVAASSEGYVDVGGIAVSVVDTVGAGDSFGAVLVAALVEDGAFGPGAA
jgi:fructokinase